LKKPEGGTREAHPTDFPPFFQTNLESRIRRNGLFFRQEAGSKSNAIFAFAFPERKNFWYNTNMENVSLQKFFLYMDSTSRKI
jgi:hypothetical protein